jgi:hypothetical protein
VHVADVHHRRGTRYTDLAAADRAGDPTDHLSWCPGTPERSPSVEGPVVAGEPVEDLLGAPASGGGSGSSLQRLASSGCRGRPQEAPHP